MNSGDTIPSEYRKIFEENFALVDADADGKLTHAECGMLLRGLGQAIADSQMEAILSSASKFIDFNEFCTIFVRAYRPPIDESTLTSAFSVFDCDGTGKITEQKLRSILKAGAAKMSELEISAVLADAAIDSAGLIDYKAFASRLVAGPKGMKTVGA